MYLAEVAEFLLAKGHTQAMQYVMGQAVTFYTIANKRDRAEMVQRIGAYRTAQSDEKSYKKVVDGLS